MDAHLQNNQTSEDNDILASPDRIKGTWGFIHRKEEQRLLSFFKKDEKNIF